MKMNNVRLMFLVAVATLLVNTNVNAQVDYMIDTSVGMYFNNPVGPLFQGVTKVKGNAPVFSIKSSRSNGLFFQTDSAPSYALKVQTCAPLGISINNNAKNAVGIHSEIMGDLAVGVYSVYGISSCDTCNARTGLFRGGSFMVSSARIKDSLDFNNTWANVDFAVYKQRVGFGVSTPSQGLVQINSAGSGKSLVFLSNIIENKRDFRQYLFGSTMMFLRADNDSDLDTTRGFSMDADGNVRFGKKVTFAGPVVTSNSKSLFLWDTTKLGDIFTNKKVGIGTANTALGSLQLAGNGFVYGLSIFTDSASNSNEFRLFQLDNNTFFSRGADTSKGFYMNELGNVSFKNGISVKGSITADKLVGSDGSTFSLSSDAQWSKSSTGIQYSKGNVAIGDTISKQHALYVNGQVGVKGIVYCEELKVDPEVVPDYVFEDDYKLRKPGEIKQFLDANKHLPGIPSAKEITANGLSVGEMQMKLLEKVEELTLYMLQQQKDIDNLKQENEQLKHHVAELQNVNGVTK